MSDLSLMENYKNAEKRVQIYDQIIKEHKKLLKQYDKNSKEYKELRELIDFIKGMDDYKKVNKDIILCMLGMIKFN